MYNTHTNYSLDWNFWEDPRQNPVELTVCRVLKGLCVVDNINFKNHGYNTVTHHFTVKSVKWNNRLTQ